MQQSFTLLGCCISLFFYERRQARHYEEIGGYNGEKNSSL